MTNERLLTAVLDVLADQGVAGLSVRAVAHAAGVSAAQVQYYYRTKRDLVRAAYDHAWTEFVGVLDADQPQTLTDVVLRWLPLDDARERRARVWLAYAEMAVHNPALAAEAARQDADLRAWYASTGLPDEQAAQLFAVVDGVTVQCLVLPLAERRALVERTVLPLVDRMQADLLTAGSAAPSPGPARSTPGR